MIDILQDQVAQTQNLYAILIPIKNCLCGFYPFEYQSKALSEYRSDAREKQ